MTRRGSAAAAQRAILSLSLALALIPACSGSPAGGSDPSVPDGSITYEGRVYAPYQPPSSAPQGTEGTLGVSGVREAQGISPSVAAAQFARPEDMSEAELAEAITPVLVRSGDPTLYRTLEPATELAHAVKLGQALGQGQSDGASPEGSSSGQHLEYLFQTSNPGVPTTQDSRFDASGLGWPYTTIVFMQVAGGACTGTYVGPHTLVTAAHCLYSAERQALWSSITFTPNAKGQNGSVMSAPFGSYGPPGNGVCYNAWFPSAWANNPTDLTWDYGTIDFRPCGNPTIAKTGWMGITPNATVGSTMCIDGYPGWFKVASDGSTTTQSGFSQFPGSQPGCGWGTNPNGDFPLLCGECWITPAYWTGIKLETQYISASPGDSGGPWWQFIGNSPQLIGIASRENYWPCGFLDLSTCYGNQASGITTTVWNFIVSTTEIGH